MRMLIFAVVLLPWNYWDHCSGSETLKTSDMKITVGASFEVRIVGKCTSCTGEMHFLIELPYGMAYFTATMSSRPFSINYFRTTAPMQYVIQSKFYDMI